MLSVFVLVVVSGLADEEFHASGFSKPNEQIHNDTIHVMSPIFGKGAARQALPMLRSLLLHRTRPLIIHVVGNAEGVSETGDLVHTQLADLAKLDVIFRFIDVSDSQDYRDHVQQLPIRCLHQHTEEGTVRSAVLTSTAAGSSFYTTAKSSTSHIVSSLASWGSSYEKREALISC
jgi:hypothetical protein